MIPNVDWKVKMWVSAGKILDGVLNGSFKNVSLHENPPLSIPPPIFKSPAFTAPASGIPLLKKSLPNFQTGVHG